MRPADASTRPDEDRARLLAAQASVGQVAAAQTNGASHGFVLPARLTVTGDGVGRAVRLGSERLEPRLRVEVAPRSDASARLTARFTWKGDTPLFPGLVSLYNDGVGVGKRGLNLLAPGEELSLPFGVDDLVRVERAPVKEETTENGVLVNVTKTRSTDLRAKVTNRHAGPVELHVEDRIPVAESNEIKVERREVSPAPTSEGGKDRPGTLAWDRTLAPGASLDLRVAYAVTWPRSAEIQQSGPVQGPRLNY